ncbi:MAG: c-type cytochrome biogenesis protein CcmI [Burkholderiales bacterium]|nr:MAG: c-type cytochrome biogenesis protein CcmI [Burkholderiales bacterium]
MALWISIAIVTLLATALVVWPLVSPRRPGASARHDDERRLAVFRDRRREIDRERDAGRLTAAEAEQAHADLVRQLAEDLPEVTVAAAAAGTPGSKPGGGAAVASAPSSSPRAAWAAALFVAVLVPLVALGVYREVGAPHLASADSSAAPGPVDAAQVEAMIDRIEQRTREQPDDAEAWAMLAEARKMQGRHDEAVAAFAKAIEGLPNDARLLTDYAESAALRAGGNFAGQPVELLERALKADPNEPKAVALMGAAQYRLGNLPRARSYLKQLETFLTPGGEEAAQIAAVVQRIDAELGGAAPADGSTAQSPAPSIADASAAAAVAGTVAVDPSLAEQAAQGGTLFVIARAAGGPPVPIAVVRVPAPAFPVSFRLDDTNAMDPSRRLGSAESLELEARLSRSGEAMRKPGDLYGRVENVRPGADGLRIVLDQVVPR